jgi:8-oxo-dGTP diphosphatase
MRSGIQIVLVGRGGERMNAQATVAAIIIKQGRPGEILLTRRNVPPFEGQWCLPGGHIDQYEPAQVAVVREVKEETGLDFDAQFFDYFDEIIIECEIHAVVLVFVGVGTGTLTAEEREVTDAKWVSIAEARSLPLAFSHNQILDAYADQINSNRRHPYGKHNRTRNREDVIRRG